MKKKQVCVCVTICMCVVVAAFYLFWHAYHAVSLKPVQIFFSKLFFLPESKKHQGNLENTKLINIYIFFLVSCQISFLVELINFYSP